MTSPNTGLRRHALVVLAVGAAIGASACSAGQISQTANQVPAVDGGHGSVGELHVNDLQVVIPEDGSDPRVGFAASFTGYGFGDPVALETVEINGVPVQFEPVEPLERGCTIIFDANETPEPAAVADELCLQQTTGTLPASDDLHLGTSVPATVSFSNGDRIETDAGIVGELLESDAYERPAEYAGVSEEN